jgi:hypothetical protein
VQVRHGSDFMQEQVKTKIVIKKYLNWHEDFTTRMVAKLPSEYVALWIAWGEGLILGGLLVWLMMR